MIKKFQIKNLTVILLICAMITALCACGKNEPTPESFDNIGNDNRTEADPVVTSPEESAPIAEVNNDATPEPGVTEPKVSEPDLSEPNVNTAITVEDLGKAYSDFIEKVANDCYSLDELAFATVDINNDGTRELLYAESSVNAAGVYVCFYNNGDIIPMGPFGCYGGIKYAPAEGKIISVMDNMDYMKYELVTIDGNHEYTIEHAYAIEPNSEDESYYFFLDDEEVPMDVYAEAFTVLQSMDVRSLDYYDMYMYTWCSSAYDPIGQRFVKLLTEDERSHKSHMFIPMVEKAKLVGTWEMYSSEIEGQISYAEDGEISGTITVHEDYTVDFDFGRHKMSGMRMDFYHGSFNDYADNTDWYVVIDAFEEDGTTIYMNVSEDDKLTVNTIGEGETLISLWDIYNRAK